MKGFYDKILPAAANKLGKKYGAQVGTTHIPEPYIGELKGLPGETAIDAMRRQQRFTAKREVHVLPITDAMRAEVGAKGFPLFAGGMNPLALATVLKQKPQGINP